jgi:hypothetical protein
MTNIRNLVFDLKMWVRITIFSLFHYLSVFRPEKGNIFHNRSLIGLYYVPTEQNPYVSYTRREKPNIIILTLIHGSQISTIQWPLSLLTAYINLPFQRKNHGSKSIYHTTDITPSDVVISSQQSSYEWNKFPSICHCVPLSLFNLQII